MSQPDDALLPYSLLRFYATSSYPCSYLPEQTARSHVVAPVHLITTEVYGTLLQSGFRRSGVFTYRPGCDFCKACISVRLNAQDFRPNRSQRRAWTRHGNLQVRELPLEFKPEHYELYSRYQSVRHQGSSMDQSDTDGEEQYVQFLLQSHIDTRMLEFSENGIVRMVSIVDWLDDGLSAVYTFYDPDISGACYGTFSILWQLDRCLQEGKNWLYLGYWIRASQKMSYKTRFQPIEGLIHGTWQALNTNQFDKI